MKINTDQLPQHLKNKHSPIYLVSGDEILLVEEACEQIRKAICQQDDFEKEIYLVDTYFDWAPFLETTNNLSLFSQNTLLELRIPQNKISEMGKKTLMQYAENPPDNKVLLILMKKLDARTKNTKWFKTLEKHAECVFIWPITAQQLPFFLQRRLQAQGFTADSAALRFIAERVEGNLLAAQQEIEKLTLLFDKTHLTLNDVISAVCDYAHYDIFNLMDCALMGDAKRTLRILINLKNEGVEPTLILWAFTREIRHCVSMMQAAEQGENIESVLQQHGVWEKRKPLFRESLSRHSQKTLAYLLRQAAHIDRTIKGATFDDVWIQFNRLSLNFCGTR